MRLIDADALKEFYGEWTNKNTEFMKGEVDGYIDAQPTIEAEPVRHGRWVNPRLNKYGHPCHQCSECLFVASQKDRHFCPDCGAKMEGGDGA